MLLNTAAPSSLNRGLFRKVMVIKLGNFPSLIAFTNRSAASSSRSLKSKLRVRKVDNLEDKYNRTLNCLVFKLLLLRFKISRRGKLFLVSCCCLEMLDIKDSHFSMGSFTLSWQGSVNPMSANSLRYVLPTNARPNAGK